MEQRGYERIKVIGKGAFGAAVLVRSRRDNQLYVAKEVNLANMKPAEKQEAKNEIKILSRLSHPNITRFADAFEIANVLYIVMEYADGGDLWARVQKQGTVLLSEEQVMGFFVQLCLALNSMHNQKILHRDLKGQNVFLTSSDAVKLGDFGISTILRHTVSMAHTKCGTPYYFSPEICANKPYNQKSDIWSLGCILYELCALRHPFNGNSMNELIQRICSGKYPAIPSVYSEDLRYLLAALLNVDPNQRPTVSQILSLDFVQGRARRYADVVAYESGDTRPSTSSSQRDVDPRRAQSRQSAVEAAKKQLQQQDEENRRQLAKLEEQEAIERVRRQIVERQRAEREREREREKGKQRATSEQPLPAKFEDSDEDTPGGGAAQAKEAHAAPPRGVRQAKAEEGERIMDIMLQQHRRQIALAKGIDPARFEQEEQAKLRELEENLRVERRMREQDRHDRLQKEKERMVKLLAKRKARAQAEAVIANAANEEQRPSSQPKPEAREADTKAHQGKFVVPSSSGGLVLRHSATPKTDALEERIRMLKQVQAEVADRKRQEEAARLEAEEEAKRAYEQAQKEKERQLQLELERERAKLAELEERLKREEAAWAAQVQVDQQRRKEWEAQGWDTAALDEQMRNRQLELIQQKLARRGRDIALLDPSQAAQEDALQRAQALSREADRLMADFLKTEQQAAAEDKWNEASYFDALVAQRANARPVPAGGPSCEPALDHRRMVDLARREHEGRTKLVKTESKERKTFIVQLRKAMQEMEQQIMLRVQAAEARQKQEKTAQNRQRLQQVEAERKAEREREKQEKEEHRKAQLREQEEEIRLQRERIVALELRREAEAMERRRQWDLQQEELRRKANAEAAKAELGIAAELPDNVTPRKVIEDEVLQGSPSHELRKDKRRATFAAEVVEWLVEDSDEAANPLPGDDKNADGSAQEAKEWLPTTQNPYGFGIRTQHSVGDLSGVLTVIAPKKETPAVNPPEPAATHELSVVQRPSANKGKRKISLSTLGARKSISELDLDSTAVLDEIVNAGRPMEARTEEEIAPSMFSFLNAAYESHDPQMVHDMVCHEIAALKNRKLKGIRKQLLKCGASSKAFNQELLLFAIHSDAAEGFAVLRCIKVVYAGLQAAQGELEWEDTDNSA
eukprot:TRINITY_DN8358_c0_g1_i3.p1 TRINITY_DN8358_c0_g1~~TRINITY_DN8358_c0_g1_i3.p1  ORF type:complete len:1148 (+),score=328.99 TRINITY_DN8358_c0_g1_i3:95-3538(+)